MNQKLCKQLRRQAQVINTNQKLMSKTAINASVLAALREVERWDSVSGIDDEWPIVMKTVREALRMAAKL